MTDKEKLTPLLNAFKKGDIDFDYAVKFILSVYDDSRRMNFNSLMVGAVIGAILCLIIYGK